MANWCTIQNERKLIDNIIERKLRLLKASRGGFNKTGKDLSLNDLNKALFVTVYLAFVTCIMAKSQIKFGLRDRQKFSKSQESLANTEIMK